MFTLLNKHDLINTRHKRPRHIEDKARIRNNLKFSGFVIARIRTENDRRLIGKAVPLQNDLSAATGRRRHETFRDRILLDLLASFDLTLYA